MPALSYLFVVIDINCLLFCSRMLSALQVVWLEKVLTVEACILCNSPVFTDEDPEVNVTKIGMKTLINASQQR